MPISRKTTVAQGFFHKIYQKQPIEVPLILLTTKTNIYIYIYIFLVFVFVFVFPWVKGHSQNQTKHKRDVEKKFIFN